MLAGAAAVAAGLLVFYIFRRAPSAVSGASPAGGVLRVVAAENVWGSLAAQIGGSRAQVVSFITDPNADPHEYESNTADARAVAGADYVIENGAGYDSWMNRLLGASPDPRRRTLDVASLLGAKNGDNPHFWYSPDDVNRAAAQMAQDFEALDPAHAAYYEAQYRLLQASLAGYQARIADMKRQFGGTKVAATEDIFSYLAAAAGLDLVSPPAFTHAIADGNDPPAASVVEFENQLKGGEVKLLVYNEQTVTPLADSMKRLAAAQGIPVVAVTEMIRPPGASFEAWMEGQIAEMQSALGAKAAGQ